ncbi:MAG: hypothetical protein ACXAEN_24025, partial [Candidatus Thorarchaeota archaeon]
MSKNSVFLVCLLMGLAIPMVSEDAEAGLGESNIWETVPLDCLDATEGPTTLLEYGSLLYIGTYDSAASPDASIYSFDGTDCTRVGDTGDYYVYASVEFDGFAMWGTRELSTNTRGGLFYYDSSLGFNEIPKLTWYGNILGAWVESMHVNNTDWLYVGGSDTDNELWGNGGYVLICEASPVPRPCNLGAMWTATTINKAIVGQQDDIISLMHYDNWMYAGAYDPARVYRYYEKNTTWWVEVANPDGAEARDSQGVYFLMNYSNECLHYGTYKLGYNGTLCGTGLNWFKDGDQVQNARLTRSIMYNNVIYYGVENNSGYQRIGIFNNRTFNQVFQDDSSEHFKYFEEFNSELYSTNEENLYVRRESSPRIRITSPQNNQSIYGFWRLNAKVDTDKSVTNVIFRFADYDDWFDATWDTRLGIYYYEYLHTDRYPDGSYYLEAYLNHTDGTYSVDNISFIIDNDRHQWIVEDDDGILKETYNLPWVPPVDMLNGPDYIDGLTQLDPYYVFSYTVVEASSSPAAAHTSYNPYDITENDVEILEDIVWLSEVPDALNIWINDTKSTSGTGDDSNLVNDAGVTSYNLAGQNITIEADTTAFSFIRRAKIRLINSFLWTEKTDGSYGTSLTFYNNMSADFTNVVFFVGAAEKANLIIPIDVMEATVWDQTNGLSLHNGKEFTTTSGGFWLAISTLSAGTSRSFTFNYYALKEVIATQLILSPYLCDTSGSPYSDKPIRCLVNRLQPNDEDFEGTVIIDLSEVSMFGKINWNRVLMRTQTDNQVYSKGTDWYVSGDYQITMPNMDIGSGESITWEIFIGTVERSPGAAFDSFGDWGWFPAIFILFYSAYRFMKGLEKPDKS